MRLNRCLIAAAAAAVAFAGSAHAETIVGLTTANQLVRFDSATPGTSVTVPITGLGSGEMLLSIDQRPIGLQLYGISSNTQIYVINTLTGAATPVGTAATPAIATTDLGIDFNPTVDRIRFVDATGGNRRFVPTTGATAAVDTALSYSGGGTPRAVGVAYTNSQTGGVPAGSVREFIIDSALDSLAEVGSQAGGNASFNGGVSTLVGSLGVNTTDEVGFDISGLSGVAYASLTPTAGSSSLYTINLATGAATPVGAIGGSGTGTISDIAVLVPEPTTAALAAAAGLLALSRRRR
jgi:hypothetical protein